MFFHCDHRVHPVFPKQIISCLTDGIQQAVDLLDIAHVGPIEGGRGHGGFLGWLMEGTGKNATDSPNIQ
jgi:hypothetical protein